MIHVLILEDDRASMEALEKILMEYPENICVHAASSYEEAKALLAQDIRYGLFLLDVNLGGENREESCSQDSCGNSFAIRLPRLLWSRPLARWRCRRTGNCTAISTL